MRGIIEELSGVRIDADDGKGVVTVLTDPFWKVRIDRNSPTFIRNLLFPHRSLILDKSLRNQSLGFGFGFEF